MATQDRRKNQGRPAPAHGEVLADYGPLALEEIIETFRGEWVLMRVTEHDEDHFPAKGYVVARAPSQEAILDAQERAPRATVGQPYYTFLAHPDITSGPEYEAAVKRFVGRLMVAKRAGRDDTGR